MYFFSDIIPVLKKKKSMKAFKSWDNILSYKELNNWNIYLKQAH